MMYTKRHMECSHGSQMKTKKQKANKKPETKKPKRDLSEIKRLILERLQKKKTTLDKKIQQEEVKEEKKETLLERISTRAPDFGVSRPQETGAAPVYEPSEISDRTRRPRDLERTALEGGVSRENTDNITYSANLDPYNKREGGGEYRPKGSVENDIAKDIRLSDAIKREVEFNPERFIGYKTNPVAAEAAYRSPEDIDESIKKLEEVHMEDFIRKQEDMPYNPNRVLDILEKDKKEFEKKYKRG